MNFIDVVITVIKTITDLVHVVKFVIAITIMMYFIRKNQTTDECSAVQHYSSHYFSVELDQLIQTKKFYQSWLCFYFTTTIKSIAQFVISYTFFVQPHFHYCFIYFYCQMTHLEMTDLSQSQQKYYDYCYFNLK